MKILLQVLLSKMNENAHAHSEFSGKFGSKECHF